VGIHLYAGDARASEFVTSAEDLGALLEVLDDVMTDLGLKPQQTAEKAP
jgi:hypothetical protein